MRTGIGERQVARHTGLTRAQLRYLECQDHITDIARVEGRRRYTPAHLELLTLVGLLYDVKALPGEAVSLAREIDGGSPEVAHARLRELAELAFARSERYARLARELGRLLSVRLAKTG
jgi:DNA-binding transcriptional MerR regulator